MSDACCDKSSLEPLLQRAKWALWFALVVNLVMFFVELRGSFRANSESLKADSLDFLADSISYIVTLFVLRRSEKARDRSAAFKGGLMTLLGLWVLVSALHRMWVGQVPEAPVMGAIGFAALLSNVTVALVLYQFRSHDMNMQSVWLCSRNDAIANISVMLAAAAVWISATKWPDLLVAGVISALNISAGIQVLISLADKNRKNSS